MPELPEVESIRRSLAPRLVGRTVTGVTLHRRDVLVAPGDPFGGFSRQRGPGREALRPDRVARADLLLGATITRLDRRGKQLALVADSPMLGRTLALGVQLGMTGQLFHRTAGQRVPDPTHIHATWRLDDGGRLIFRDARRFGNLRTFVSLGALTEHWAGLGPDALTVTAGALGAALSRSDRPIKAALLDQSAIAGVGNIYADEALFDAEIAPTASAGSLRREAVARLAAAVRAVLTRSLRAGGSTLRDFVDAEGRPGTFQTKHRVYGRAGKPCPTCARPLTAARVAQRATVWCRACQR